MEVLSARGFVLGGLNLTTAWSNDSRWSQLQHHQERVACIENRLHGLTVSACYIQMLVSSGIVLDSMTRLILTTFQAQVSPQVMIWIPLNALVAP